METKNSILNFKFEDEKEIRTIILENKEWFVAKDIAELLGYTNSRKAILDHTKNAVTVDSFSPVAGTGLDFSQITTPNNYKTTKLILEPDVLALIQKATTISLPEKENIIKKLNLSDKFVTFSRKEIEFFVELRYFLNANDIQMETQYKVLNYRIDGYIKEFNLAVEFDESHHNTLAARKRDLIREKKISDMTGCSFVRLTDGVPLSTNLGLIMKHILKGKENA